MKRPLRIDALLRNIYENVRNPASFSSPLVLYRAAKKVNRNITYSHVVNWLAGQKAYTLHKSARAKFRRRKVLVRGLFYQYQADLLDFQPLKRDNSGTRFLLTIIDCFSRYAMAIPIKSKHGKVVKAALQKAFKKMKIPKKLQTDQGREFYNRHVSEYLQQNNIVHFSVLSDLKAQMVERFNRTLRAKILKYMIAKKTLRYVNVLPDIVHGYNSTPHSALEGLSPKQVKKSNEKEVWHILYDDYLANKKKKHQFEINDFVRLAIKRGPFTKMTKTFGDDIFIVSNKIHSDPPTYNVRTLKDHMLIDGTFYESQLQKIFLPQ